MINKKILFFVGMIFLILVFSSFINGATKDIKIDWNGYSFEWCDGTAGGTTHNVETCGYNTYKAALTCYDGDGSGTWANIVYSGDWYTAKCKAAGHDVNNHFGNWFGGDNDNNDYTTLAQSSTATCYDDDGDNYYRSVFVLHGTNLGIPSLCGSIEDASCDNSAANFPWNAESCTDNIDNNCDGQINEGCATYCSDLDGDGYVNVVGGCAIPSGKSGGDCDDSAAGASIHPGAIEICGDGKDNDCSGGDLTCPLVACTDADGDKYAKEDSCTASSISGFKGYSDCDDTKNKIYPNAPEICDFIDNQCSGNMGYPDIDENPDEICPIAGDVCRLGTCKAPSTYFAENPDGTGKIPTTTTKYFPSLQKVYLVLEDFPIKAALWEFEIYEKDSSGGDDSIRTGGNKLIGISQGDKIIAEWDILQNDINNAQSDDVDKDYDFYFTTKGFNKLGGEIDGDIRGSWERETYGAAGNGIWKGVRNNVPVSGIWNATGWKITQGPMPSPGSSGTWKATILNLGKPKGTWESEFGIYLGTWNTTIKEDESVYDYTSQILNVEWQTGPPCANGDTQSCGTNEGECKSGTQICSAGSWGTCDGEIKPTTEICDDNKDNDCDGTKDETDDCQTTIDCTQYNLCSQITNQPDCNSCPVSSLDGCEWTTSCNPYEDQKDDNNQDIHCVYQENTDDTCEDGRLDYLLELTSDSHADCDTKSLMSIFCSAQTSLPLENKFEIFLTIISIIGIYFIFFRIKN